MRTTFTDESLRRISRKIGYETSIFEFLDDIYDLANKIASEADFIKKTASYFDDDINNDDDINQILTSIMEIKQISDEMVKLSRNKIKPG